MRNAKCEQPPPTPGAGTWPSRSPDGAKALSPHLSPGVYCSHVLEHVPDDRRAMAEFHRVLKPTGWALLLVPIFGDATVEDPAVSKAEQRLEKYGHPDHVRIFGKDYVDRLRDAGFSVEHLRATDFLDRPEMVRQAVDTVSAGDIYRCTKVD